MIFLTNFDALIRESVDNWSDLAKMSTSPETPLKPKPDFWLYVADFNLPSSKLKVSFSTNSKKRSPSSALWRVSWTKEIVFCLLISVWWKKILSVKLIDY